MTEEAKRVITGNIDLTLNLTDRRGIKISGYVYSDDTPKDLNERVDRLQDVLDRQAIRCDITVKEAQIAGHVQNLQSFKQSYAGMLAIQNAGKKLTSQQKNAIDNYAPSVERAEAEIASLRAAIAEARKKLLLE